LKKEKVDVENLQRIQGDILHEASKLVKSQGVLVYSTCTVGNEENVDVVQRFLETHHDFELDTTLENDLPQELKQYTNVQNGYVQLLPHYFGTDGFFIARLWKKV
jgi:16S rRNA (cytosine967-C5)-methyltransferase